MIEGDDLDKERTVNRLVWLAKKAGAGGRVARELATRIVVDEKLVVRYKAKRRNR